GRPRAGNRPPAALQRRAAAPRRQLRAAPLRSHRHPFALDLDDDRPLLPAPPEEGLPVEHERREHDPVLQRHVRPDVERLPPLLRARSIEHDQHVDVRLLVRIAARVRSEQAYVGDGVSKDRREAAAKIAQRRLEAWREFADCHGSIVACHGPGRGSGLHPGVLVAMTVARIAPPQTLITSTSSRTAAADFLNAASSPAVSLISRICSSPRAPSLHGTPTKTSRTPYSPCRNTEHGMIFFLSRRMASTISTTDAPGAYQALVPTSFVISAPPFAVRSTMASIVLRSSRSVIGMPATVE